VLPSPDDPSGPNHVRLKILSSPKPPCPAMYFHRENGTDLVQKHDLEITDKPNGRKVYLHQDKAAKSWVTKDNKKDKKQKSAIRPLDPEGCKTIGGGFWFHIDFDNLSEAELDLLCFALTPTPEFRHKLGMGKPIGLGTVHIQPTAILGIARQQRYAMGVNLFGDGRYHNTWQADTPLPSRWYARESTGLAGSDLSLDPRARAERHAARLTPAMRNAIRLTGEPERLKPRVPVHYPLSLGQPDDEAENFQWFVANVDKKVQPKGQMLARVGPDGELKPDDTLTPLQRNRKPPRG
jgi:hypothetical protein